MYRANTEYRRDCDIGQLEVGQYLLYQISAGFGCGYFFPHVEVEDCASCVFALELILVEKGLKGVVGKVDGQLGTVGIVNVFLHAGLNDFGIPFPVFFGKAVSSSFRRCCFEII